MSEHDEWMAAQLQARREAKAALARALIGAGQPEPEPEPDWRARGFASRADYDQWERGVVRAIRGELTE